MAIDEATIVKNVADNPVGTTDNHVNRIFEDVLTCFVAWLDHYPSDQKNHQILLALGTESLKRVRLSGHPGKFDKKDIAAAAHVADEVDLQSWFRWPDVEKYWLARRDSYLAFAKHRGIDWAPVLHRLPSPGRNPAEHWLDIEPLQHEDSELPVNGEATSTEASNRNLLAEAKQINYEVTQSGEVKCSIWLKPWLSTGSFHFNGWRRLSVIVWLLAHGCTILLAVVYAYALAVKPELITMHSSTTLLLLAGFAYAIWHISIRPVVLLLDDRIIHVDSWVVSFKEDAAQLEVMNINKAKIIRLVRYTAVCPICGATVSLNRGEPDFRRRLVGQCAESPQEHLFSFDRVTRKGVVLR